MNKLNRILPTTTIEEIRLNVPDGIEVLESYGLECFRCIGGGETLAAAAQMHNLDLGEVIDDLSKRMVKPER